MRLSRRERHERIGGSDCSAILGINPYRSPFDVWAEKTGQAKVPLAKNQYTYFGNALEPILASKYAENHHVRLVASLPRERSDKPWFTGTPDRLILGGNWKDPVSRQVMVKRGIEIKTAKKDHWIKWGPGIDVESEVLKDWDTATNHPLPLEYVAQVQWYMGLMDFPEWDLIVKLDSADYREYRLLRDEKWIKEAEDRCGRFWADYIQRRRPPPLDWGVTTNKYLSREFSKHGEEIRKAEPHEEMLIENWKGLSGELEQLEDESSELVLLIRESEERLFAMRKRMSQLGNNQSAIKALLRERIGFDAGLRTEKGDEVTWIRSSKGTRIMRKKFLWNPPSNTGSKLTSALTEL